MLPKVIDLFSGCGGLALGFQKAGFEIAGGIEMDQDACNTALLNLSWSHGSDEDTHICGNIKEYDGSCFKDKIGSEGCIVIGGPPCQAYSLAGRAKLKSLGEDRINTKDERGYLYKDFLRFVFDMDARAVVMENVPAASNYGDMNILEIVCKELDEKGYEAHWTILNAADYGVPQKRERAFVIAVKRGMPYHIPVPLNLSPSDGSIGIYARQMSRFKEECEYFIEPGKADPESSPWVTVGEAFEDLPVLFPTPDSKISITRMNIAKPYKKEISSDFQKYMRKWSGNEKRMVTGNVFRKNKRDFPIFQEMKEGDNYTQACKIADRLFAREAILRNISEGTQEYEKLKKQIVPPYDRTKFERKWQRISSDKPCHTVVAHLSKDTYAFIHPWEPRGISVREAARLQSFPDNFTFNCNMGAAYKQIGNAVPPLLSYGIAQAVKKIFKE